ncbi:STAS-like domain-containing protein [Siccibacter turicensis]|nr:STAS-like domain-containing protein [Siccibacter turicensis]
MIKVADRYPCPGPRYKKLGSASGEDFRDWIEQELAASTGLIIDLDGTEGYGSSFLEESFGGLIRKGYDIDVIRGIELKSEEEPELIDEIKEYIEDAIKDSHG